MTKQEFQKLTEEGILLLDGATGSNLYKAGMPRGVSTEQWILEHPQVLKDLQRAYVRAGSRIVYAPTFAANSISLKNFGLEKETERLNMELFQVSREAVGHEALVAGDVTTTGKLLEPAGELTYETLVHVYQEQIGVLARAGADLLVLETMMGLEETMAALDAAKSVCDLPVMCTLSLESDGTARFGGGGRGDRGDPGCHGRFRCGSKLFLRSGSARLRDPYHASERVRPDYRQTECRDAGDHSLGGCGL